MVETVVVTGHADKCGYVFAPENKAAGGTYLEWAHYRLCQAENMIIDAPSEVYNFFADELSGLWDRVQNAYDQIGAFAYNFSTGLVSHAIDLWHDVEDFAKRVAASVGGAFPSVLKWGEYIGIAALALAAIWLTEK